MYEAYICPLVLFIAILGWVVTPLPSDTHHNRFHVHHTASRYITPACLVAESTYGTYRTSLASINNDTVELSNHAPALATTAVHTYPQDHALYFITLISLVALFMTAIYGILLESNAIAVHPYPHVDGSINELEFGR